MKSEGIVAELQKLKNPEKARLLGRFFKCAKGEYGEGDIFWGIMVPLQRQVAKKYFQEADLKDAQKLLDSPVYEQRLTGLLMLVLKFGKADEKLRKVVYNFYLKNTKRINNWDLVDLTAPKIVGGYLLNKDRKILYKLARSKNLWERRIAVLATFMFIRDNQFADSLKISEILLNDKHDLIHKAVGWMLREIGKRDIKAEEKFLQKYYRAMPRTMLRYAIEKFPERKRKKYLEK
ncbi:MAG: DNA alkylation repair protein [Parcubacteria group bacterium]